LSLLQIDPPKAPAPLQPLIHLDALWVQVAGTVCNLSCGHCFVSCGPSNHHHSLMSRAEVGSHVTEALGLGVKELYFTGGEPFLHPELIEILSDALPLAPCTVLTNGTLFTASRLAALASLSDRWRHSLELRVSLDGPCAGDHDRLRGAGSFDRALAGILAADQAGLMPIVTVTQFEDGEPWALRERYRSLLHASGVSRPRLKVIPLFRLGREAERTRPYDSTETLRGLPPEAFDPTRLQCARGRAVTSRGVYVCPLLVEEDSGRMGDRLSETLGPFAVSHGACFTCHLTGMTCANH
jgi:molybdenum cofactor biosynthesis enzyme MoaA